MKLKNSLESVRAKEGAELLGIALSTFWKWSKDGKLPKGYKLSARTTVWSVEELQAFRDEARGA